MFAYYESLAFWLKKVLATILLFGQRFTLKMSVNGLHYFIVRMRYYRCAHVYNGMSWSIEVCLLLTPYTTDNEEI